MDKPQTTKGCRLRIVTGVAILLVVMAAELALSVRQESQTFDEACHIFAGYRYWKNSDFGINFEHPPLVKLVAAVPLLWLPLKVPTVSNGGDYKLVEYAIGREFLYRNDANSLLWRARLAASVFTISMGLAVFLVAYSMFGVGPAFLALTLLVFEPNILAHGALVTTDIGVTLGLFLGVGTFYLHLKKPSNLRLVGAGLAAGLCLGAKHSGILLLPMLVLLALTDLLLFRDSNANWIPPDFAKKALRHGAVLASITAIALTILWSFYDFRYSARPAGLELQPSLIQSAKTIGSSPSAAILGLAHWHLIPEAYLAGIVDVDSIKLQSFVFGKYYPHAQWFYFPAVFIIKSTLALLFLCALAPFSAALWQKQFRREVLFFLIPAAFYVAVAMYSGVNYGIRHLLPIYPFLIVLVAFGAWHLAARHRALAALVVLLVVFHAGSSVRAFPNYIPYANELWGGPKNTYRFLADSNVDWGQGLKAMKRYIDDRHIKECWFGYFGSLPVDVSYYGIPCKGLPTAFADLLQLPMPIVPPQVEGPVFISATEDSGTYWRTPWVNPYKSFQGVPPAALIADSILVYDGKVDLSGVSALTHENLAMRLARANNWEEALAEADTAVKIAPNRPATHVTRSLILAAVGKKAEADEEIARARTLVDAVAAER